MTGRLFFIFSLIFGGMICGNAKEAVFPKASKVCPGNAWCYGLPGMGNREFWNGKQNEAVFQNIVKHADRFMSGNYDRYLVRPPDDLYLEFSRNGNRTNYQNAYSRIYNPLASLTVAACVTGDERYVRRVEQIASVLCSMPSWVLPAHDRELADFNGKRISIDLVSSNVGAQLSAALYLLKDKMNPSAAAELRENLLRRIVDPIEKLLADKKRRNHWLDTLNNWNSVCIAGVVCTILPLDLPAERRWKILDGLIECSDNFLKGFDPDGYCSEGMGYWDYGFGHYLILSAALRGVSGGKIDLMTQPRAIRAGEFPGRIEILNNVYPAFADCSTSAKPYPFHLALRDWLTGKSGGGRIEVLPTMNMMQMLTAISASGEKNSDVTEKKPEKPAFSVFKSSGVVVGRPGEGNEKCRLAVAFKGGSNNEFHNHNDVGSYVVLVDGTAAPVQDVGGEIYTARTFSSRRYESNLLNSFGHSVPLIDGKMQQEGKNTQCRMLDFSNQGKLLRAAFDLRNAYRGVSGIKKLVRTFVYDRTGEGMFTVTDEAEFSTPQKYENAIMTLGDFTIEGKNKLIFSFGGKKLAVEVECNEPFEITSAVINEARSGAGKPCRVAIKLKQPAEKIRMTLKMVAQE